jgi:hypothetical protein
MFSIYGLPLIRFEFFRYCQRGKTRNEDSLPWHPAGAIAQASVSALMPCCDGTHRLKLQQYERLCIRGAFFKLRARLRKQICLRFETRRKAVASVGAIVLEQGQTIALNQLFRQEDVAISLTYSTESHHGHL